MAESLANPRQTGTDARPSPPNQRPLQGIFLALRLLGLERELSCLTARRLNHSTVAAAVAGLIVVAAAGRAEAQVGTGGTLGIIGTGGSGGTAFAAGDFFTSIQQQSDPPVSLTTFQLSRFFNKANCDCSTPVNVFIALLSSGIAKRATAGITTGTVSIVLGTRVQLGLRAANWTGRSAPVSRSPASRCSRF